MTTLRTIILSDATRLRARSAVDFAEDGTVMQLKEPNRTLEQNAAQWPILEAFSDQLKWPVNGYMVNMRPDEWKDVLTAAFQRESVRLAQGLDGGVVMLGIRTSAMGKKTFSAWLEFLHATAALRGVTVYAQQGVTA